MIDSGGLKERRGRERERGRRDERGTGEVEERGEGASGSRFRGQNQQRPRDPQRFILIIPFGIFSLALHGVETSILIKEVSPPAAHWSRAKGQISRRDFRSIRGGDFIHIPLRGWRSGRLHWAASNFQWYSILHFCSTKAADYFRWSTVLLYTE